MAIAEKVVGVRNVDGLKIVFYNEREIYVDSYLGVYIFNRWFHRQAGFYRDNWKPFRNALKHYKSLTIGDIIALAQRYEISICGGDNMPDLSGLSVTVYPSGGRKRKR